MPEIQVTITGLSELADVLNDIKPAIEEAAIELVNGWCLEMVSASKELAPVDLGQLRASINFNVEASEGEISGVVGPDTDYGAGVEFGTLPHYVPFEPLEAWAGRHGMEPGAGWRIQNKIANYGTDPQPYMGPAFDEVNESVLPDLIDQFVGRLTEYIETTFGNPQPDSGSGGDPTPTGGATP
jgi:HK97 gp10 family phage protein